MNIEPPVTGPAEDKLSADQLAVLKQISELTPEELDSVMTLINLEPDMTAYFGKRKAFALVFGSLKKAATWFAAFTGALWLGFDKIQALFAFIIDTIIRASS